jgi:hypothetical protein
MGVMTPTTPNVSRRHDTLSGVPSRGTDRKSVRVDAALWDEFGEATAGFKDGRSGVLRDFMRWFLHKPDAELPQRATHAPPETPKADDGG